MIRYHGGPVQLVNVTFVNCWFELDLPPSTLPEKANRNFSAALLDSPNQTLVRVQ